MRFLALLVFALALAAGSPTSAAAQPTVTSADMQHLQDSIYDASRDIAQTRGRDAAAASTLEADLDKARDEATDLKVKLLRNEPIARSEYDDVRDHIEDIRNRARGDSRGGSTPPAGSINDDRPVSTSGTLVRSQSPNEIPAGTELDVRLQSSLSSQTAQVEDRIEATTMVDLRDERGRVIVLAGSLMRGIVSSVNRATRLDPKGSLTVAFDRITINGRSYPIRATVSQALESEGIMGEKEKKGAIAGVLIGGGGTIAATEGKDVELPSGTVLRVRMDAPLTLER
jgi:hypothetical protein